MVVALANVTRLELCKLCSGQDAVGPPHNSFSPDSMHEVAPPLPPPPPTPAPDRPLPPPYTPPYPPPYLPPLPPPPYLRLASLDAGSSPRTPLK